jgi:hypothetical protein
MEAAEHLFVGASLFVLATGASEARAHSSATASAQAVDEIVLARAQAHGSPPPVEMMEPPPYVAGNVGDDARTDLSYAPDMGSASSRGGRAALQKTF